MTGFRFVAVAAVAAVALVACARPDRLTDISPEPSAAPTAQPSAAPSTAPSTAPTATPASPSPTAPPPAAASCQLPAMPDNGNCARGTPAFSADVERAIDEIAQMYPGIFDQNDFRDCGRGYRCWKVLKGKQFEQRMVERLEAMGYCAKCDEECGVKDTNRFNEQYDLMVADGYLRRGEGAYRSTCYPAAF